MGKKQFKIAIEGVDGVGKSLAIKGIINKLLRNGMTYQVICQRDNGIANNILENILNKDNYTNHPESLTALAVYMSVNREYLKKQESEEVDVIIYDRSYYSTLAYTYHKSICNYIKTIEKEPEYDVVVYLEPKDLDVIKYNLNKRRNSSELELNNKDVNDDYNEERYTRWLDSYRKVFKEAKNSVITYTMETDKFLGKTYTYSTDYEEEYIALNIIPLIEFINNKKSDTERKTIVCVDEDIFDYPLLNQLDNNFLTFKEVTTMQRDGKTIPTEIHGRGVYLSYLTPLESIHPVANTISIKYPRFNSKYNIIDKYNINRPKTLPFNKKSIKKLKKDKEYIFRTYDRAEGQGMIPFTGKSGLKTILNHIDNGTFDKQYENMRDLKRDCFCRFNNLKGKKAHAMFYISEELMFLIEYRVVMLAVDNGYKLFTTVRENFHPGSKKEKVRKYIGTRCPDKIKPILPKLCKLMKGEDLFCCSFDIYVKPNGSLGLFEFNPTFGTEILKVDKEFKYYLNKAFISKCKEKKVELNSKYLKKYESSYSDFKQSHII